MPHHCNSPECSVNPAKAYFQLPTSPSSSPPPQPTASVAPAPTQEPTEPLLPAPQHSPLPLRSAPPNSNRAVATSHQMTSTDEKPSYPKPLYRVHLDDAGHKGTADFLSIVSPAVALQDATRRVLKLLYDLSEEDKDEKEGESSGQSNGQTRHTSSTQTQAATVPASSTPIPHRVGSDSSKIDNVSSRIAPTPSKPSPSAPPPPVRSVTLILRELGGVANTSSIALDKDHKQIQFNTGYIASQPALSSKQKQKQQKQSVCHNCHYANCTNGSKCGVKSTSDVESHDANIKSGERHSNDESESKSESVLHREVLGVLAHEMVHVWQYDGLGTCPGGLVEGIADWVRLNTGLGAMHWVERVAPRVDPTSSDTSATHSAAHGSSADPPQREWTWDAGYERTGFFLDWLEKERVGKGTVRKLNAGLMDKKFVSEGDESLFFKVCGEQAEVLFEEYQVWLEKREKKMQ